MQWEEQNREKTVGEERISSYLEALSSHAPVPSGGGASALSASLAFSLLLMVGNLTLGKARYASYEERLKKRMKEWEEAREKSLSFAKEDEKAFIPLAKAYRMKKETEEEKRIYMEEMEKCLYLASEVPFCLLLLCAEEAESVLGLRRHSS